MSGQYKIVVRDELLRRLLSATTTRMLVDLAQRMLVLLEKVGN